MEDILIAKLIATSAKQIGMFLVILAVVTAAIVAFIIYTMTLAKVREIAVLKLIGATNRTIAGMILQQALGLGVIGFLVGRVAAGLWGPVFPKYVLLLPGDAIARLRCSSWRSARSPASSPSAPRCASTRRRPSVARCSRQSKLSGLSKRYGRATPPSMR